MNVIDFEKVSTLIESIDGLVKQLSKYRSLEVHQRINQSYYMQQAAELRLLTEQLEEAALRIEIIQERIGAHYQRIHPVLQHDIRWLEVHLRSSSFGG